MKKSKFIAGALVLSMGLLGTGYAYWTDALSVNATVSTGELKLSTKEDSVKEINPTEFIKISEIKEEKNGFSYNVENLYPGVQYEIAAEFENDGTIPAVVDEIIITSTEGLSDTEKELLNKLTVTMEFGVFNEAGNQVGKLVQAEFPGDNNVAHIVKDKVRVEPGQVLKVNKVVHMDEESGNDLQEIKNLEIGLEITYVQHNSDTAAGKY